MSRERHADGDPRGAAGGHHLHSLHFWHAAHVQDSHGHALRKRDRLLVGVVSGALLFYLIGKALGLGRGR